MVQQKTGVFSGMWIDVAVETSYIRFDHNSVTSSRTSAKI